MRKRRAAPPTAIPMMEAVLSVGELSDFPWVSGAAVVLLLGVGTAGVGVNVAETLTGLLDAGVGVADELMPDEAKSVATMVAWVLGAASEIPAHMPYAVDTTGDVSGGS